MQYKVIWATEETLTSSMVVLEQEVNHYLSKGWELQGGVSVTLEKSGDYIVNYVVCQAMVKKEK